MKTKDLFLLSWKKFSIAAIVFIAFFFYRNLWGRLTGIPGNVFSNIAVVVILIYLAICVIYSLYSLKGKSKKKSKKKKKRDKMKSKDLFLLSWKKFALILIAWVAAVVIHNFGSALLGFEEPVFFLLAVIVIPVYFIISIIYSIIKGFKK